MQPKSVVTRFVATHDRRRRTLRLRYPPAHPLDQRQHTNTVAAIDYPNGIIPMLAPVMWSAWTSCAQSSVIRVQQWN
jgi:hypothetical protein